MRDKSRSREPFPKRQCIGEIIFFDDNLQRVQTTVVRMIIANYNVKKLIMKALLMCYFMILILE